MEALKNGRLGMAWSDKVEIIAILLRQLARENRSEEAR
jgi:hypothetical protein